MNEVGLSLLHQLHLSSDVGFEDIHYFDVSSNDMVFLSHVVGDILSKS